MCLRFFLWEIERFGRFRSSALAGMGDLGRPIAEWLRHAASVGPIGCISRYWVSANGKGVEVLIDMADNGRASGNSLRKWTRLLSGR